MLALSFLKLSQRYFQLGLDIQCVHLIMKYLQEAIENNCYKLDFVVLNWNPAQEFYKKYGAIDLTSKEKWNLYRFSEADLKKLASDCE